MLKHKVMVIEKDYRKDLLTISSTYKEKKKQLHLASRAILIPHKASSTDHSLTCVT